ncbi:hypothetical protein TELCIR_15226 [Teladorsagia circumcincta]|uniref:Peptidase M28 domain-containing protein n=1 Tax=Teladorsagia circumcincta TaxID=45464 RepID=A0A2G9TZ34_TELCI|nr:hypothetical protein TELCIR_15226 [Teladorsagia circumcincta]
MKRKIINFRMKACIGFLALGIGIALFVAGAVMLGIGISKDKSSNDCPRFTESPSTIAPTHITYAGIQWLAYSPNGTVTGDVVFCGQGYEKEFQYLLKDVYPNTVFMPEHSVQRGTLKIGDGDVLSPLYAGKPILWKTGSLEKARADGDIPSIPAIPISYTSAMALLSRLGGPPAPSTWQGGLNVTYNLGPGLKDNMKTTITINGQYEVKQIRNVIGYINGNEEPERYVILGNHFDAWTYGALDPNSGTSILAEVARAIMQVVNETGWRPGE